MQRYCLTVLILWLGLMSYQVDAEAGIQETFEDTTATWAVSQDIAGSGTITQSSIQVASGTYSALLQTAASDSIAALSSTNFSEPAAAHDWQERPGKWNWQRASVFVPSTTIAALQNNEYFTLAGFWASANPPNFSWYLRVRVGGQLSVAGVDSNGSVHEFLIYGSVPLDQWFELEIGLHSQAGNGVGRSFAVLIEGAFYGWYRQGRMASETYDRAAMGIISTDSPGSLTVYVDQWRTLTTDSFPDGPDSRSTANLQEQDYRNESGVQVQYDWSTWGNTPILDSAFGLYSANSRLQAGRNIDRMPSLSEGWGEIEIDWPNNTPPSCISNYCSAMIGFYKEVNREENLEIIPHADASGTFHLFFEAWLGGEGLPVVFAHWRIPNAAAAPGRNMLERGDIIRARWEIASATDLRVRASYYDASASVWFNDIIDHTFDATNVSNGEAQVNYFDGYHTASSITIDSPYYSIRRFKVGTLASSPMPVSGPTASPVRNYITTNSPTLTWSSISWASGYQVEVATDINFTQKVFTDYDLPVDALSVIVDPPLTEKRIYYWRVRALNSNSSWSQTQTFQYN
jgi:hypothetical protein